MGAVWTSFAVIFFVSVNGHNTAATAGTKPVSLIIGLTGSGKSTSIKNLCGVDLRTGSGVRATTLEELAVDCGDQQFVDTCGLIHLVDDGSPVENAFHRGLEQLLSFLDGKEIGRIYVLTSSSYMKDIGRILEQVDFIKSVINPLIPWTAVVNCFHGVCPSAMRPEDVPEFLRLLKEKTGNSIEINAQRLQPSDMNLFPTPTTMWKINLPPDWRERIKKHDIASIRANMESKAIETCKEHQAAFLAAASVINNHQCTLKPCAAAASCDTLPACPDPNICTVPRCGGRDQCKTEKKTQTSCGFFDTSRCNIDEYGMDAECVDAVTQCNSARARSCDDQLEAVTKCNNQRSAQCLQYKAAELECNTQRAADCVQELAGVQASSTAVMALHKPYVDDCQKFYTMK